MTDQRKDRLWKYLKQYEKCLVFAYFALALLVNLRVYAVSGNKDPYVDILLYGFGCIFGLLSFTQSIIDYEYEKKEERS